MDSVATFEYRSGSNRVKEELKAYWTVLLHTVLHTNMVALQQTSYKHMVNSSTSDGC